MIRIVARRIPRASHRPRSLARPWADVARGALALGIAVVPPPHVPPAAAVTPTAPDTPGAPARSGYAYLGKDLRALQDDPFANPGALWVDRGQSLWREAPAAGASSCADCHGGAERLRGLAPTLPRWDPERRGLVNLELLIQRCRTERQGQSPFPWEEEDLLALTTLLASVSRGLPLEPVTTGPAAQALARGEAEFRRRRGQLDLSCADCHERNAGRRLRGDVISQGQVNGFPIYRLTWQTLGSRHRMFRWCNEAVRAEPYAFGSDPYLALELYLVHRGRGLPVETPAVRR